MKRKQPRIYRYASASEAWFARCRRMSTSALRRRIERDKWSEQGLTVSREVLAERVAQ